MILPVQSVGACTNQYCVVESPCIRCKAGKTTTSKSYIMTKQRRKKLKPKAVIRIMECLN